MRYVWCALSAGARLFTVLAWLALAAIVLAMPSMAAPVTYTTKGRIVLSCDGTEVSQHNVAEEASESAINYAVAHGGKASCVLNYPDKTLVVDIPLQSAPACPPQPADETQTAQCPAGTTGSWQQTQSYGSVAYPTCWVPSGFIPSTAPEGACTAIPPPTLPAPGGISATTSANQDRYNVNLSWLAVTGATRYEIERCTGSTCTNFAALAGIPPQPALTNTAYPNTFVPGGITYRYRIRGMNATLTGLWSAIRNVTTPPPPPTGTGTASLSWSWDGPPLNVDGTTLSNLAGYRIVYGTAPTALTNQVTIANAAAVSHVVENLATGTWYFGIVAFAGDSACLQPGADCVALPGERSNLATKIVQ